MDGNGKSTRNLLGTHPHTHLLFLVTKNTNPRWRNFSEASPLSHRLAAPQWDCGAATPEGRSQAKGALRNKGTELERLLGTARHLGERRAQANFLHIPANEFGWRLVFRARHPNCRRQACIGRSQGVGNWKMWSVLGAFTSKPSKFDFSWRWQGQSEHPLCCAKRSFTLDLWSAV